MKKTLLIAFIILSFFVGISTSRAYNEELSPMLDLNAWNVSFDTPNETNLNLARNWVSNYCINYNYYVISTQAFYKTIGSDEIKDNNPIYVYCFNDSLSLSITSQYYGNNSNIKYLDIGSSDTNGIIKYFYDNGLEYYSENNKTGPFSNIRYGLGDLTEIKFPYVETNIEDVGVFSKNAVLSRGYKAYNSLKYNDLIYNNNDKFIDFKNKGFVSPSIDYDYSYKENRQLYSLDFYFKPEDISLNKNFEIYIENLDLTQDIFDLDAFKFYGLVNENGLYHWEDIYVANEMGTHENYTDYEITYKGTGTEFSDNTGFLLKIKDLSLDFMNGKYEKIRFSITFKNAKKYKLNLKSYYDLTKDNYYYNILGTEKFVLKNNTKKYPYLIFSTKKDSVVSALFTDYDNKNHILYSSYFNTNDGYSGDTIFDFDSQYTEMIDTVPLNIGLTNKQGFWISSNHDDYFDYYVYYNGLDIYYSLNSNHDLSDSIYIDDTGTQVELPLIPQEGDPYRDDSFISYFKRAFKKFSKIITYILENISDFFRELPGVFQDYYVLIFGFIIFVIVLKFIL